MKSTPSKSSNSGGSIVLTNFERRSDLLTEVNRADQLRSDALANTRLAIAELAAQLASVDLVNSDSAAAAASHHAHRHHDSQATMNLRRDVNAKAFQLRELRSTLATQAAKLDSLRTSVATTGSVDALLEGAQSGGGQSIPRGGLPDTMSRALQVAHARVAELMGSIDDLREQQTQRNQREADELARLENQHSAAHDALRRDIELQHKRIRALKARLEEAERDSALQQSLHRMSQTRSPNRAGSATRGPDSEETRVQALRNELVRSRAKQLQLWRLQWAYLVAHPTNIAGLRSDKPIERVREAMAFLKSTVIHFGQDIKKIRVVLRQSHFDKEQVFKQAHNELKLVVGLMLPREDQLRFQRSQNEQWPVTEELIQAKFPPHKLDTSYSALQEMVVSWDAMSEDERQRLTTAHDVVANAEVLYLMARYIAHEWREKRLQMKHRVGVMA